MSKNSKNLFSEKIVTIFSVFLLNCLICIYAVGQPLPNKIININIFGGINPYNNSQWNNWNEPSNQTSQVLNYADGISSGVTIRTSQVFAYTENFAPYPTTMCPTEVGRYAMFSSTGAHTLTFNNLKTDGTLYDLEIYSSRKNTGNITRFTVNGQNIDINTASNFTNVARFFSIIPNASRQLIITITRTAGTFAYVNGLKLTERSSANQPPTVNAGNNQTITLPTNSVTLNGTAADADGTVTTVQWNKVSGPAQFLITTPNSLQTSVTGLAQGVYDFELIATDNSGNTGKDTVRITVNPAPPNQPPTVNAGNNQTITLPTNSVTLNGTATDVDGTITAVQWNKINGPAQFSITSPNSLQTSVTGLAQGVYDFELIATDDDGNTGKDTVRITVNPAPPNQPPTVNAGNNQTITLPANSVTLVGTAADADGTITAVQWNKINGPAQFSITSPNTLQTSVPGLAQGVYDFELIATDNSGNTGKDTVRITVNPAPPNQPPTVNAGNNQTITLPANSVTLVGTAADADGTITAVQWNKINGPAQFSITSPNSLQTSVTGLAQGVYDFELIATDNSGNTGKDTVRITVNPAPPNDPTIVANMTVDSFPRSSEYETYGLTKLPPGYAFSGNKRYPLLLWLHSASEGAAVSSPASTKGNKSQLIKMANVQSPVQWIANGWNLTAVNPKTGLRDTFIVIAPQHYNDWSYSYNELRFILPDIISRYRVDTTRLYMMGISAGGGGINTCMGSKDSAFINRIAAAVTMISASVNSASGPAGSFTYTQVENNLRFAAGYGTRVWTIAGEEDSFVDYDLNLHKNLNTLFPTPRMKFTVWTGFGHINNGPWLDTNRRPISNFYGNTGACNNGCNNGGVPTQANNNGSALRGSGVTQDSLNVLEWLLLYQRNTPFTSIPTAVAGNDQTITLPSNSVTLNGTGSNPGSGASFSSTVWEKVLGPSPGSITLPNAFTTTVTGLTAGNYVFKLTVINSFGLSHTDMIRITVYNNQSHWFPTVSITSTTTQNITSSTSTLTGTATTTGTGIKSIRWMKIKTPNQTPKKFVWLGSSSLAGTGVSAGDSAFYNRILAFGNANGLFSSNINLAESGTSIFQCMPSSYTPQANEDAPLTNKNISFALANHADAHAIIISYPSNDYDALTVDRILFAYQTVYDSAVAAGKKCFIYTTQPREAFGTIARLRLREVSDSLLIREKNGRFAPGTIISVHAPLTDLSGELMRYNSGDGIHQNNTGHRVIANNTIGSSSFFPSWANSASVIITPNSLSTTVTGLTNGTHVFMLAVTDNYDHTVFASTTINVSGIGGNQPPTVNAGNNQTITLPANSVSLNGTATDADGTITAVQWNKISGPTQFSITSPNTLQTSITGLAQGVYDFELIATDNSGNTEKDTVRISIILPSNNKAININIFGGINPYNNSQWNNWNEPSNQTSQVLTYADGISSGVTITTSQVFAYTENFAPYPTTMCPTEVGRYAMFSSTGAHTLTFNNLKTDGTLYDLEIYSSRKNTGNITRFTVNGKSIDINTASNYTNAAQFTNLLPNASGQIIITITRAAGTFAYVNGLKLTEVGIVYVTNK